MTDKERIAQLEAQVAQLMVYMNARKIQQLSFPVDDSSKAALGVPTTRGAGSTTTTQTIALSGNAQNINVPAAYARTVILEIEGDLFELPSLV